MIRSAGVDVPAWPFASILPRAHPAWGEMSRLLVEGRSNRAIAETLSLSERTVENHVLHILTKLDVGSRTPAVTYAVRHGLA